MTPYMRKADSLITADPITRQEPSPKEQSWNDNKNATPNVKVAYASGRLKTWGSAFLLLASAVAPLVALLCWVVHAAQVHPSMLKGTIIGGHLSYIQAKAIDFICSALLAPLLMVLLDLLWFSKARISAIDERRDHSLPLSSMVVASNTSAGGFDILKIRALMQGKTWTLSLLALLVLFSGLSGKMLSNFIGYEAFNVDEPNRELAMLRLMLDGSSIANGLASGSSYSTSQQSALANQMTALLTGLNFESAISKLDAGGGYIGTNATAASMNALDSSIVGLTNVPGHRLSVDCQQDELTQLGLVQTGDLYFEFSLNFKCPINKTSLSCAYFYIGQIPGDVTIVSNAYNDEYSYVAFTADDKYALLGILDSFNQTQTVPSLYGDVLPSAFNMTPSGFQGTKSTMTTWGLNCHIQRQEGLLNYSRSSGKPWTTSKSSFSSQKNLTKSYLVDWQTVLNYRAPIASLPGLGPALANTAGNIALEDPPNFNWTIFALNYLYASGEVQRIQFEVAATNSSSDPSHFFGVSATVSMQYYRIIYIPILLLLGLLGVLGAAAVTSAMVFHTRNTYSTQIGRVVDNLRLLVDSVAGLTSAAPVFIDAAELDESNLRRWAEKFQVQYNETLEDGHVTIRLVRLETTKSTKG